MTSQDMTHDTGPGEDDEVVVAEIVEEAGVAPRVPVVGVDPAYVDLYRRLRAEGGVDLQEQLHNRYLQLARGGVTAGGLPWPSPTDPVAEGADAIRALAEAVDAKLADTGWTTIIPDSGYTNLSAAAAYGRIGMSFWMRGPIIRDAGLFPTSSSNLFTLPVGSRPATYTRRFAVAQSVGGGRISISPQGLVTFNADAATSDTVYLDSVHFRLG